MLTRRTARRRIRDSKVSRHRNPSLGLTLLELIVATLLASLAMSALVGLLSLIERQRKVTLPNGSDSWRSGVVDLFERDLIGARQIAFSGNRLILLGHALDGSYESHVPTETTISLEPLSGGERHWLIRQTRILGQGLDSKPSLVCGDVLRWEVERIDDFGRRQPISKDLSPAPRRLSFRIWFQGTRNQEYAEQWLFVAN